MTTTVSSTRTPPIPGQVDAGLDGHDDAGAEDSSRPRAHRRGLVDVEARPRARCRARRPRPSRPRRSGRDRPCRRRRSVTPAAPRPRPASLGAPPTTSKTRARVPGGLAADAERAGHVRAVARRRWRRSRPPPGPRGDAPLRGRAWGLAALGPDATMVSKRVALGPAAVAWPVSSAKRELVLGRRLRRAGSTSASAASAMAQRLASCGRPRRASFTCRSASTTPLGGPRARRPSSSLGPASRCAAQVTLSASRPSR